MNASATTATMTPAQRVRADFADYLQRRVARDLRDELSGALRRRLRQLITRTATR